MYCRNRHLATLCALLVLAVVLTGPAADSAEKEWQVTLLPTLTGWSGSVGNDVSDSGYTVGAWIDEDGGYHAAYWYKDTAYDLEDEIGVPEDHPYSYVYTVNSNGVMVGAAHDGMGNTVASRWDVGKGTVDSLHPDEDYLSSVAQALNASGDAAGFVGAIENSVFRYYAWFWPKGDDEGERLPSGDFLHVLAHGMNSKGTIVGLGMDPSYNWHAVIWEKGTGGDYEIYDLQEELNDCEEEEVFLGRAWDVNEDGTVVGFVWLTDFTSRAFTWTAKDGAELLDDDGTGEGIAWRAVSKYVAGGIGGAYYASEDAAVWIDGDLEVLPDLDDYSRMTASGVNRNGVVVGYGFDADDTSLIYPQAWSAEKK